MDTDRAAVAGAVHDFNNALQSISASLVLIERRLLGGGNAGVGRLLQSARDQLTDAGALVRWTLLGVCSAEERVDLCALLHGMVPQIEAVIGEEIAFDLQADGAGSTVLCDPLRLRSGLLNTVLNARDAMDGGGLLTISVRQVHPDGRAGTGGAGTGGAGTGGAGSGPLVEVAVTDTGRGMDADFAARAFEPFVSTKADGPGTGLGLSQLKGFVEGSRGFVRLNSRQGAGTSVTILLPLAE